MAFTRYVNKKMALMQQHAKYNYQIRTQIHERCTTQQAADIS